MNNIYKCNNNFIENRGDNPPPKKNKFNFKKIKNNIINYLNNVECFLNNFNNFYKYIKLYKILK